MARIGLMKKYIKMARDAGASTKTLFKKAWILQKKKAKTASAIKRKSTSKGVKKKHNPSTSKKGVRKVATKKKNNPRRPRRRIAFLSGRTVNALWKAAMIVFPALVGVWAVNQIPWVKEQRPWIKSLVQAAAGILGLSFVRTTWGKMIASGVLTGGVLTLVMPYMPEQFRLTGGRGFTADELTELQMGIPVQLGKNRSMGIPYQLGQNSGIRTKAQSNYAY